VTKVLTRRNREKMSCSIRTSFQLERTLSFAFKGATKKDGNFFSLDYENHLPQSNTIHTILFLLELFHPTCSCSSPFCKRNRSFKFLLGVEISNHRIFARFCTTCRRGPFSHCSRNLTKEIKISFYVKQNNVLTYEKKQQKFQQIIKESVEGKR